MPGTEPIYEAAANTTGTASGNFGKVPQPTCTFARRFGNTSSASTDFARAAGVVTTPLTREPPQELPVDPVPVTTTPRAAPSTEEAMDVQPSTSGAASAHAPTANAPLARVTPRVPNVTGDLSYSAHVTIEGPFVADIEPVGDDKFLSSGTPVKQVGPPIQLIRETEGICRPMN
jgi:hypothetical protein